MLFLMLGKSLLGDEYGEETIHCKLGEKTKP
jgi:hypothetical protein